MFTGIIEETGKIKDVRSKGGLKVFEIAAKTVMPDLRTGDSLCVDGACLTVVEISRSAFKVEALSGTLSQTTLGRLKRGDPVNLERAVKASGRLGGHIVSGHVDGIAFVKDIKRSPSSLKIVLSAEKSITGDIVSKGSVAVNGVSLTVAELLNDAFSVAIIPHTLRNTALNALKQGDRVNIETDMIGKYVRKALQECR